jgi:hypothetical protein
VRERGELVGRPLAPARHHEHLEVDELPEVGLVAGLLETVLPIGDR